MTFKRQYLVFCELNTDIKPTKFLEVVHRTYRQHDVHYLNLDRNGVNYSTMAIPESILNTMSDDPYALQHLYYTHSTVTGAFSFSKNSQKLHLNCRQPQNMLAVRAITGCAVHKGTRIRPI